MKYKTFVCFSIFLTVILFACSKHNNSVLETKQALQVEQTSANNNGAIQISGVGFYAAVGECDYVSEAAYAIRMTGDFEGCLYAYIDEYDCSPSGTYRESGREYFVGTYKGKHGTFWTTYKFEAKYEGCRADGAPMGAEIFGRCQHPLVEGSGTGVFKGVTGQINFKDDIEAGNFPYRGHLRF
jgi:hypothetical protein